MDHRPDRRHEVVPARLAAVGDAARPRRGRRARARGRVGADARPALVGDSRRRCLRERRRHPVSAVAVLGDALLCHADVLSYEVFGAARSSTSSRDRGLGPARLRRLLGPHARGRGHRRRDVRAGAERLGRRGGDPHRRGGGRPRHRPARRRPRRRRQRGHHQRPPPRRGARHRARARTSERRAAGHRRHRHRHVVGEGDRGRRRRRRRRAGARPAPVPRSVTGSLRARRATSRGARGRGPRSPRSRPR